MEAANPEYEKGWLKDEGDKYEIVQPVGRSFNIEHDVLKVKDNNDEFMAAKVFKQTENALVDATREFVLMTRLSGMKCPNIIKPIKLIQKTQYQDSQGTIHNCPVILMEYAQNKDMDCYLSQLKKPNGFPAELARGYFKELIGALSFMHSRNICHRNIRPSNLMLDEKFNLKIGGFGRAVQYQERTLVSQKEHLEPNQPKDQYTDPTDYLYKHYQDQGDIYSAGVILMNMLFTTMPFPNSNIQKRFNSDSPFYWMVCHNGIKLENDHFVNDSGFRVLITGLLCHNKKSRLPIWNVFSNSWVTQATLEGIPRIVYMNKLLMKVERAMKKPGYNSRSLHFPFRGSSQQSNQYESILNEIQFDSACLKQTFRVSQKDLIISGQPKVFLAMLKHLLKNKSQNLLEEQGQVEDFYVTLDHPNQQQVIVQLNHEIMSIPLETIVVLHLFKTTDGKLCVKFAKWEGSDHMQALKVIRVIKTHFEQPTEMETKTE